VSPRLLIANPNTTQSITDQMVARARAIAGADATFVGATAPFGAPALECQEHLQTAELAVLSMMQAHENCDGMIISAFGDPGLERARRRGVMPVVGMGEAGMLAASSYGRRFTIVTVGPALMASIHKKVQALGLQSQLAHVAFLAGGVLDLASDPQRFFDEILQAVAQAKTVWGADTTLLGGAPFSGLSARLAQDADLPLYDGLTSAVVQLRRHLRKTARPFG
jgi:allantoin racemase